MGRTADYAIQGFLYQFNKTLLEILKSTDDSIITVEGIVEDIDVVENGITKAIQCKYHEAATSFNASTLYKPLLQMMHHFHLNSTSTINYILFAHFPSLKQEDFIVDKKTLEDALKSKNKEFNKYVIALNGKVDIDNFLLRFEAKIGPSFDKLVDEVHSYFINEGISSTDAETLYYPNAINFIAELSRCHDVENRKTTKNSLLTNLSKIKVTAISHWTLSLRTRKILLESRKKQLKPNLSRNDRLRYFLLHANKLDEFENNIVIFICDYLSKYHFKDAHRKVPVFCIDAEESVLLDIERRLFHRGFIANTGLIANEMDENHFFREPMSNKERDSNIKREFSLRLLSYRKNIFLFNKRKPQDFFVIGEVVNTLELDLKDVNLEELGSKSFNEINYMLGLADVYE
ncbi:hypothetical protein [Deefgea piscis]|uniref:hypothetical protein n=1 Tax=Deefgea piscis TaxID=2739061 RepID=UPI001C826199|nr:hypothetical protein [Deefgea piscis]QZA82481.1 hypothetical protein K4H25_07565 [Deefgea piscis]